MKQKESVWGAAADFCHLGRGMILMTHASTRLESTANILSQAGNLQANRAIAGLAMASFGLYLHHDARNAGNAGLLQRSSCHA